MLPARFRDELPPVTVPELLERDTDEGINREDEITHANAHEASTAMEIDAELRSNASQHSIYDTDVDSFGIFRSFYRQPPSFTSNVNLDSLCDSPNFAIQRKVRNWWSGITRSLPLELSAAEITEKLGVAVATLKENYFRPFMNASSYHLIHWFYNGTKTKTLEDLDRLVQNVLLKPDFVLEDLKKFRAARESQRVDVIKDEALADSLFQASDGWYKVAMNIPVPFEHFAYNSIADIPLFKVESLFFQRPIEVVKAALQDALPEEFHLQPFKMYWQHDEEDPENLERVYTDLYNADEFLKEQDRIQMDHETSEHEIVIAAMMFWSDETHLANFGTASSWPGYLFLGNQSKYVRCKPGAFAAHHLAYIPKVYFIFFFKSNDSSVLFSCQTRFKTFAVKSSKSQLPHTFCPTCIES